MINSVTPWLDANEVRQLAERLSQPIPSQTNPSSLDITGDAFEGFTTMDPVIPQAAKPQRVDPPVDPPISPAPLTTPTAVVAPVTTASQPYRPSPSLLLHFRNWMRENFSTAGIFLLDRDGQVLFDENHNSRMHFVAKSIITNPPASEDGSSNIRVKIHSGLNLELIPVKTEIGWLVLGAEIPEPLPAAEIDAIRNAVKLVASPPAR